MQLLGTAEVFIGIQNSTYRIKVTLAADLREPMLLGLPFLRDEDGIVDFVRGVLYAGKAERITVAFMAKTPERIDTPGPRLDLVENQFPASHQEAFKQLIQTHATVFGSLNGHLSQTKTIKHEIKITTEQPFRLAPYRYSEEKRKVIDTQVREMLAAGIIEPATSPYCSPIVMAKKKDGSLRFCVDYQRLNALSEDAAQPIPRIPDALRDLGDASIFSTIDLKSGYWQIPMHPQSKKYTSFATPSGGTYVFRVMPFGLKGAPGTFQRLMSQEVLCGLINKFCIVYLDDIIIFSKDWDSHLNHLAQVLERLKIHNLTGAMEKCRFGMKQLEYLGFKVTPDGIETKKDYCTSILETPIPTNKKELQSFIGTCTWLHEYVPHLATLMAPLTNALRGKRSFRWTAETQAAFQATKKAFEKPLKLSRPIPGVTLYLQTDASAVGMGAVLYYLEGQSKKIISFASAKFRPTETKYHCSEQECLAVIWATRRFAQYLDKPFILRTDCKALTWLGRFKDTRDKLHRWSVRLTELSFKVEHCPGKQNELPDSLSRRPLEETHEELDDVERMVPPDIGASPHQVEAPTAYAAHAAPLLDEIRLAQQVDEQTSRLASRWVQLQAKPQPTPEESRFLQLHVVTDGLLWQRYNEKGAWRVLVPKETRQRVLFEYHDSRYSGHPGADETLRAILENFWWPRIRQEVNEYVLLCHLCTCTKASTRTYSGYRPRQPTQPWKTVSCDLMGPYPRTARGNKFILVITDLFSRWTEAFAISSSDAAVLVKKAEQEVFSRFGYPEHLLSDNGPQFISHAWEEACEVWQCGLWTTGIYQPWANPTERRNQEIKKGLRLSVFGRSHKDWDLNLPQTLFHMRSRRNAATGVTPAYALFGKNITRPGDWKLRSEDPPSADRTQRIDQIFQHQRQYTKRYAAASAPTVTYAPGELVYLKSHTLSSQEKKIHAGFNPKFDGPFPIERRLSSTMYLVNRRGTTVKVHINEIKHRSGVDQYPTPRLGSQPTSDDAPNLARTSDDSSRATGETTHQNDGVSQYSAPPSGSQPVSGAAPGRASTSDDSPGATDHVRKAINVVHVNDVSPLVGDHDSSRYEPKQPCAQAGQSTSKTSEAPCHRYNLRSRKK